MSQVPAPALQLTVTAPNGTSHDYTEYLAYSGALQEMTITQNFGRQGDTALFPLVFEYDGTPALPVRVDPMSQVRLHDSRAGQVLFGGLVTNPSLTPRGVRLMEWDLHCTDYTFFADKAVVRHGASSDDRSDDIVVSMTNGAKCGISAAKVADGGFVAPGPALPDWTLGYGTLSGAWRALATMMGQVVPYGWYVDDERRLHFYDQDTALDSKVTFTTRPAAAGSVTEGHILLDSQFTFEQDGSSISNKILVQGANQVITPDYQGGPTDQWLSDGYGTSWPLRWTVTDTPKPALYVGGVDTAVTYNSSGVAPAGPGWNIINNAAGGCYLVTSSPPYAGASVQLWYAYKAPIVMQATDAQSVSLYRGPNGGVFAEYVNDSSLVTPAMALARAQQVRSEYAYAVQRVTFNTSPEFLGWVRAGYTFYLEHDLLPDPSNGYRMGLSGTFLCISNQITFSDGGYRTCLVTGVRI